ncbi:MAG: hypothetical protein OEN23_08375 [Paracoccaceae bacterium]|nr:hypothetical protein [Paracoccaceae bacterium]
MHRVLFPTVAIVLGALLAPPPLRAQSDDADLGRLMEAARGRQVPTAPAPTDPDLIALTDQLTRIAETQDGDALIALADTEIKLSFGGAYGLAAFREMIAEPWFWPEFETVLAGGGLLVTDWAEGRGAVFPVVFQLWPADLDPFEYYYGFRSGAVLRATPAVDASILWEGIEGRVLARGPYLTRFPGLYEEGWYHVCLAEAGCGFARTDEVRSPLDWRAIFIQSAEGGPWVLKTFIAGD